MRCDDESTHSQVDENVSAHGNPPDSCLRSGPYRSGTTAATRPAPTTDRPLKTGKVWTPGASIGRVRALFSTMGGHGHLYPVIPLLQALAGAGHQTAVAVPAHFAPTARKAGLDVISLDAP